MPTQAQRLIHAVRTRNHERLRKLLRDHGDVSARSAAGRTALHAAAGRKWARGHFQDKPVVYVLGNHEFYRHSLPELTEALKRETDGSHINLLENSAVEIDGYTFLGCTLWTDFRLAPDPEAAMQAAEAIMSDYSIIQFSLEGGALRARDTARLHAESVAWLRSKLAQCDHARTIVVTHHAPSPRSEAPYHANSPLKPAFASDLDELVEKSHVPLWIHGHTHYNVDYVIGSTRVLTNQRGYPDQLCKDFLRLGVPLVEATRRAMDSVSKFTVSFGSSARNAVDLSCLFLSKSTYWRHQYGERFL